MPNDPVNEVRMLRDRHLHGCKIGQQRFFVVVLCGTWVTHAVHEKLKTPAFEEVLEKGETLAYPGVGQYNFQNRSIK